METKTQAPAKEDKKGLLGKLKESVDDREEQLAIVSTFVRLGILVWSGSILTLAYIKLPPALGIPEQKLDPTFIASVFTGVLATFINYGDLHVQTAGQQREFVIKSVAHPNEVRRRLNDALMRYKDLYRVEDMNDGGI